VSDVPEWAKVKASKDDLSRMIRAAYETHGLMRVRLFWFISYGFYSAGLFNWLGVAKMMVCGCMFDKSVSFNSVCWKRD